MDSKKVISLEKKLQSSENGDRELCEKYQKALNFLAIPGYEVRIPYEYREQTNPAMQISSVHDDEVTEYFINLVKKNIGPEKHSVQERFNLNSQVVEYVAKFDHASFQTSIDIQYRNRHDVYKPEKVGLMRVFDDIMEPKIRHLASQNNGSGTSIIIAGAAHFFDNYGHNLYARLHDLSPIRFTLLDADRLAIIEKK